MPARSNSPKRRVAADAARFTPPPSVSAPALLHQGSDRVFQKLIFDLFTVSARIEQVRAHFALPMGISGPQYSLLRAVAFLQGQEGVSVGSVAKHLDVTSAFITAQSRALLEQGLLDKDEDAADRRISRLSLTRKGERLVDEIIESVRPVNDAFFGTLRKSEFEALAAIMEKLVDSSRDAIVQLESRHQRTALSNRDKILNS